MGRVLPSHRSSPAIGLYNPKALIVHAASLRHACAHCERFSTAASRRSLGSVSVPVWPNNLSARLPIKALVGRYPTNKLIGHEPLPERKLESEAIFDRRTEAPWSYGVLAPVSRCCPPLRGRLSMYYSPFRRFTRASEESLSRSTCMPNPRRQRSF